MFAKGIVEGQTETVDVLEINWDAGADAPTYALVLSSYVVVGKEDHTSLTLFHQQCNVAWGVFGGAAMRGQTRKWPGTYRYDFAAALGALKVLC